MRPRVERTAASRRTYSALTLGWLATALLSTSSFGQEAAAIPQPSYVLLDGRRQAAKTLEIDAGTVTGDGISAPLALEDLWRIDFRPIPPASKPQPTLVVDLVGGGRLFGTAAVVFDDKCLLDWPLSERISLPIEAVRALRFNAFAATPEFEKALTVPAAELDRIFFQDAGKTLSAPGLIESLNEKELAFEFENVRRTLPLAKLSGIVLAQATAAESVLPATITLVDGSTIGGEVLSLSADDLTMRLPGEAQLELPAKAVSSIAVRSPRMQFLADRTPIESLETPIVTSPRPYQKNRSTLGRPLTLGNRVFASGLGVHSRSQLTYQVDVQFDLLAGTIGIDAETAGRGDCIFSVLADGQTLFSQRMKGSDPPREIQIDIRNRRQITLLVEPGEDLDLADHADWCDIRLIKTAK